MVKASFFPEDMLVDPRFMIERSSTDMISVEDRYVRTAIQFIRANICEKITVRDVVKQVHLCRVALENRFKKVRGHSIYQEIMLVLCFR